jgi:ribonuclease P protein component
MLSKKNRVDKKNIDLIFTQGKFLVSPSLTFKFILTSNANPPRISFIAPRSVAKLATKRNKLRRRGYIALRKFITEFPFGLLGAFVFKIHEEDVSTLENEIKNILNKIN